MKELHGTTRAAGLSETDRPRVADRLFRLKAELFRTLGHPVRVRLLAELADSERSVGDLQRTLGLESSGASQHLGALRRQGLVDSRRQGTTVYYRVKDSRTARLLELARQILASSLSESCGSLSGRNAPAEDQRAHGSGSGS